MVTKRATVTKSIGSRFQFIGNIIAELKKVTWPTRQEAIRLTVMVLIVCIIAGIFLGLADFGFSNLVKHVFMP